MLKSQTNLLKSSTLAFIVMNEIGFEMNERFCGYVETREIRVKRYFRLEFCERDEIRQNEICD